MIKVIAFDADDTLWHNEIYFQEIETKFCQLLEGYLPQHTVARELLHTEIKNIELYGYGIKAFMLSMIETALRISNNTISSKSIDQIISFGKEMLEKPVLKIANVENVLINLQPKYRLVVATKGDLLDQERKLKKSNLEHYFHHIEIMSEKSEIDYQKLIQHLDIDASEFLMVGNSLKSDILPVINVGGHAIHIPYHVTWSHERVETTLQSKNFQQVESISELVQILA
jgi:putative hydrolase of the HAD superfamily